MGPGEHCAWTAAQRLAGFDNTVEDMTGFDLKVEELRFFDHWLKDIDNGIMREPKVYYYTYGAPKGKQWRASDAWPLPQERRIPYYLGARKLGSEAPTQMGTRDSFLVSYEANEDNAAQHGLVYETEPLEHAVQVTGHPVVDLWLAASAADSDVVAYVQNVAPDGSVTSHSMHGHQRASLRREAAAPYNNLGLPWHPFRQADVEPLKPGEPVELRFDVLPFSMVFEAGHKIRLVLTFADNATPQLSPAPTVLVYRDQAHPSQIVLPIVDPL